MAMKHTRIQEPENLHLVCNGKSWVVLLGRLFPRPEQPDGGDSYSQPVGVSKLAKGLGTKPANKRQTKNRLLQDGEMREVSPLM